MTDQAYSSLVGIWSADPSNQTFGTGFVVWREKSRSFVVTCAHVLDDAGGRDQVLVDGCQVSVEKLHPDYDLALLEVSALDQDKRPLELQLSAEEKISCTIPGYQRLGPGRATFLVKEVQAKLASGVSRVGPADAMVEAWIVTSDQDRLEPGYSGAPVVVDGRAIGIATHRYQEGERGLVISTQALKKMWPDAPRMIFDPIVEHHGSSYVYVPGGRFLMGSTEKRVRELTELDKGHHSFDDEVPRHEVRLGGFYIAQHPVTFEEYAKFVKAAGRPLRSHQDDVSRRFGWDLVTGQPPPGMENHPAIAVSWDDARAYCTWLSGRLPSEAEWEKAARGTDGRDWPWGTDWDPARSNTSESGRNRPTEVGSLSYGGDSPYGAADMSGNVWEWCSTVYDPYPYDPEDGREDMAPREPRVIRGGSWDRNFLAARCAARNSSDPADYGVTIGFRVALSKRPDLLSTSLDVT